MIRSLICEICGKETSRSNNSQKFCAGCRYEKKLRTNRVYRQSQLVQSVNKKYCKEWRNVHKIWTSLASHHKVIKLGKYTYKDMPFYPSWNPDTGGSFKQGELDLISEIGLKPNEEIYELHIINRKIGVWPGNLMWVPREKHRREEMFIKAIAVLDKHKLLGELNGVFVH